MLEPPIRLRHAIVEGNLLVVKRLLKRFPDLLESIDPKNGWSSLHYASFHGRYLICVHLISLGHDKDEVLKTFKGNTSVHLALMNGHEQTTHLLLQHFPKQLNVRGESGRAPIHVSVICNFFKCVEMLLGIGADIGIVDDEGNNALHLSMKYGSLQCIKVLVQHGIDTNLKNKLGLKPTDVASSFQVEKYFREVMSGSTSNDSIEDSSPISFKDSPLVPYTPSDRIHSNSLPPLPSVTTARRSSVTSTSTTRSPVPRSAISLTFTGPHSNSYIYSSAASGSHSPSGLSIKPPQSLSSPVLYSPTTSSVNPGLIPSIREEPPVEHLLSSFPSNSSLSSARSKNSTIESRTRANSQQASYKSRSNSYGSRPFSLRTTPGKSSPPESTLNLSRISTDSEEAPREQQSIMSSFTMRQRSGSSEHLPEHQSKTKATILSIPIESLGRSRKEYE